MSYVLPIGIHCAIEAEREYQNKKWGYDSHEVGAWLTIMQVELREAIEGWCSENGHHKGLCEIMQVVAVGIACLEQHGVVTRSQLESLTGETQDGGE